MCESPPGSNQYLSRVASITQAAQQAAPGFNLSGLSITSKNSSGTVTANGGGPGDIVTVSLTTSMQLITPVVAQFFPGGAYPFTVSVTFQNEPFAPGNTL